MKTHQIIFISLTAFIPTQNADAMLCKNIKKPLSHASMQHVRLLTDTHTKQNKIDFTNKQTLDIGNLSIDQLNGHLHGAALNGNFFLMKQLIDSGADVNHADKDGNTSLHLAISYNRTADIVKLLIEAGADLNKPRHDGITPLHITHVHCSDEICGYILSLYKPNPKNRE